jgi:hypothetical protein
MPRKAKHSTQIVPAPEAEVLAPPTPGARLKAMIEQMVAERVDAALDEFQPKPSLDAQRQKSMFEQRKHALYFERWGCEICGTKNKIHESNGLCGHCLSRRNQRYASLKREWDKEHPSGEAERQVGHVTARVATAERLLGSVQHSEDEE